MTERLYDNTRLAAYKRCPRYFFFRHVMHWAPAGTSRALIFGSAWHSAMDAVWPLLCDGKAGQETVAAGYKAFVNTWVAEGGPHPDEMDYEQEKEFAPRTPGNALDMLFAYVSTRAEQLAKSCELLHTEKPFIVPLSPTDDDLFYVGKIDKMIRHRGKIIGIEHKTTSLYKKDGGFRSTFTDSFSPNSQVDGYLYALHLLFPGKVGGVWVDGALVHRTEQAFMFIPLERRMDMLDAWLWETHQWINAIEDNKAELPGVSESDRYMHAFPKNTNSCFDYNTACPYIYPCKAWPNPIGKQAPGDMEVSPWDPLEHIGKEDILNQLRASKKGAKK